MFRSVTAGVAGGVDAGRNARSPSPKRSLSYHIRFVRRFAARRIYGWERIAEESIPWVTERVWVRGGVNVHPSRFGLEGSVARRRGGMHKRGWGKKTSIVTTFSPTFPSRGGRRKGRGKFR